MLIVFVFKKEKKNQIQFLLSFISAEDILIVCLSLSQRLLESHRENAAASDMLCVLNNILVFIGVS
jgi:hypothetical protein